jgi:DHA1 family bicyclomycin/chloramphenicol resistance-like MFS transporter
MLTLAGLGLVALGTATVNLPETLPHAQRPSLQPGQIIRTYWRIADNPRFLVPALALSATFFFLFAYIGGASLACQTHHGLAPDAFGLVFGATGTAVLLGTLAAGCAHRACRDWPSSAYAA